MSENNPKDECIDREIGALLIPYALGTLSERDVEKFELHLLECSACQLEAEEAAHELDALAANRESFVKRAIEEDEIFESQYAKLKQKKRDAQKSSSSWLSNAWEFLWGRKFMVGTAGVVAIAAMFLLRHGTETIPPPAEKHDISTYSMRSLPEVTRLKPDSLTIAHENEPATKANEKIAAIPEESKGNISNLEKKAAAPPPAMQSSQQMAKSEEVTIIAEQTAPVKLDVSAKSMIITSRDIAIQAPSQEMLSSVAGTSDDLRRFADDVFGRFDPQTKLPTTQTGRNGERGSPGERSLRTAKTSGQASDKGYVDPDSLLRIGRFAEARDRYEAEWKADSANPVPKLMSGVASLAMGDYRQARVALEKAITMFPLGALRNDAALLLARADLSEGRTAAAKHRLQTLKEIQGDSVGTIRISGAIAKIDSFERVNTIEPVPR